MTSPKNRRYKTRQRQKDIRNYVINRDGAVCCYCDKQLCSEMITMEHIVPDSKRGTFNTTNLTVSCANCNNQRGNQPFFEYCKRFGFVDAKIKKYKKLYFNNLRIKVLNIAKEECLKDEEAIPSALIAQACQILKIKKMNFPNNICEIKFNERYNRKKIKFCFEKLIKSIASESY
jgi:hypothetical protein